MQVRSREIRHYLSASGKDIFESWVGGLKDTRGRAAVLKRLDRVEEGLFGDHRYVGEGVWELRINFGPGYRVYYGEDGLSIVLLLMGGDKRSQDEDIDQARKFWVDYRGQND
jgi:putative addiction module killer protein